MLHLMRQALADTAATGQDDRPAAGGDVDMVDQGAAAPDPQVPPGVRLSKAQNESLAKMAGERKRQLLQIRERATGAHQRRHSRAHLRPCRSPGCNCHSNHPVTTGARRAMPRRARGSLPGSRITRGSSRA